MLRSDGSWRNNAKIQTKNQKKMDRIFLQLSLPSCRKTWGFGVSTSLFIFSFRRGILSCCGSSCKEQPQACESFEQTPYSTFICPVQRKQTARTKSHCLITIVLWCRARERWEVRVMLQPLSKLCDTLTGSYQFHWWHTLVWHEGQNRTDVAGVHILSALAVQFAWNLEATSSSWNALQSGSDSSYAA